MLGFYNFSFHLVMLFFFLFGTHKSLPLMPIRFIFKFLYLMLRILTSSCPLCIDLLELRSLCVYFLNFFSLLLMSDVL